MCVIDNYLYVGTDESVIKVLDIKNDCKLKYFIINNLIKVECLDELKGHKDGITCMV